MALHTICEAPKAADVRYKPAVAPALPSRLAGLADASNASDLPSAGNAQSLFVNEQVRYVLQPLGRGSVVDPRPKAIVTSCWELPGRSHTLLS